MMPLPALGLVCIPERIRQAWVDWLCAGPAWEHFITFTFKESIHPEAAEKRLRTFFHGLNQRAYGRGYAKRPDKPSIIWVAGLEYQRRGVIHFHALARNIPYTLDWSIMQKVWEQGHPNNGYIYIERVKAAAAVASYVTKYVLKDGELLLSSHFRLTASGDFFASARE